MLLLFPGLVLGGPIYRWQAEDGSVHFSDQPPPKATAEQLAVTTRMPGEAEYKDHPYSIRNQVEFFQQQRERQQKMRLEEKASQQAMQGGNSNENPYAMPPVDNVPPIVPVPRRYLYPYAYPPRYRDHRPVRSYNRAGIRFFHQGDHHRFHLNLGYFNRLHRWNF